MLGAVELAALLGQRDVPTAEQVAVIEAPLAPSVIVAGAGSGKTETMAARVVWLVANQFVPPASVLGLTFTRKAAAELGLRIRRRLAQWRRVVERDLPDERARLAELLAGEPTVSTYAAYAGRLVSEQAVRIGAEPSPRTLSEAARWQLADTTVRRYSGDLPADIGALTSIPGYVLSLADHLADHLVSAEQVEQFCRGLLAQWQPLPLGPGIRAELPGETAALVRSLQHRAELMQLVREFAAAKRGAVDFGDQMALAARLAQVPEVGQLERTRYAAVLLDEYQDTGYAQTEMLAGLYGAGHPVMAVGDPFQSIYGWRGASSATIGRFPDRFPDVSGTPAARHTLATSWRNDRSILRAANALAGPLLAADDATVVLAARPAAAAGEVVVHRCLTVDDEAQWLAARLRQAWDARPAGERTAAVLVRRRAQIPLLADALTAAGLPIEVVGLGGLLMTAEVVDVVATLRVLADHKAATALVRLLTGARWRIGAADLAALHRRSRRLATAAGVPGAAVTHPDDVVSLVEALDDLGDPGQYSVPGYARLSRYATELRGLRRRASAPLAELVADVERTIGIDVEVAARGDRAQLGRSHLDRFLDEASRFAAEADEATLRAFLAFLEAAEAEEHGLEQGEVVVAAERVQILTVHGAKGLEWDVVAVPGLMDGVFPAREQGTDWTRSRDELPTDLRGDRAELPRFAITGAAHRREVRDRLRAHRDLIEARHAEEERRLVYVAVTRARSLLLASAYIWDGAARARAVSPFLAELVGVAEVDGWAEDPVEGAPNPVTERVVAAQWPVDPLAGRRAAVEAGAAAVRAAIDRPPRSADAGPEAAAVMPGLFGDLPELAAGWRRDVELLLAERARTARTGDVEVPLPAHLSVSDLVLLRRDPAQLARRLRRPLPARPAPMARRGTAFHAWLEQRWSAPALLDVDELPGAADQVTDDADFLALREAFESSEWAARTPAAIEVAFDMMIDGVVVRGRMDAVFGNEVSGWTVIDWKTGRRPTGRDAAADAVQLAAYRLAWARLSGVGDEGLDTVSAAFYYVRGGELVQPADLLDAGELSQLLRRSCAGGDAHSVARSGRNDVD